MTARSILSTSIIAALFASSSAFASSGKMYAGAGFGFTDYDIDTNAIDTAILAGSATTSTTTGDDSDTGVKVFAGYMFTPNYGVEVSYNHLGKAKVTTNGTSSTDFKGSTLGVDLIGVQPLTNSISGFGKIGLHYADFDGTHSVGTANVSYDSGIALHYGLGADFAISRDFSIRAEWEYFDIDDLETSLFSASGVLGF